MNAYRRDFDETGCMSFLIKDEEFFEKYLGKSWQNFQKRI